MPKTKKIEDKDISETVKEIILDDEEKILDPELVAGDIITDEDDDGDGIPDDEEVDPFKDRWEE